MSVYQDKKTGKWYCIFRVKDHEGKSRQIKKAGFALKREAQSYERDYIERHSFAPTMPFRAFHELYIKDISPRLKEHTLQTKRYQAQNHLLPFFGEMPMNEIDAQDVIRWQNELLAKDYSDVYLSNLHKALSSIFNHGIRYYKLPSNPAKLAGSIGSTTPETPMNFWTLKEFQAVLEAVHDLKAKAAIALLYWSGMRKGELLALTWADLDLEKKMLNIDKSYQRLKGRAVITEPKTFDSKRKIMLPKQAIEALLAYRATVYDCSDNAPVFAWEKRFIEQGIEAACAETGIKKIRVHDLRHSHASYLINHGANIVLISKRLGHKKTSITLDTYSHLYPSREIDLINLMEGE